MKECFSEYRSFVYALGITTIFAICYWLYSWLYSLPEYVFENKIIDGNVFQTAIVNHFEDYASIQSYESMKYDVMVEQYIDGKRVKIKIRDYPSPFAQPRIYYVTPDYHVIMIRGNLQLK